MIKKENGVTLIILVVTVMILMIIAGVIINSGINSVKTASRESLKTNMLLLKAKGKEYVENTNFNLGTGEKTEEEKTQIKNQYLIGTLVKRELPESVGEGKEAYELNRSDMEEMGLNELVDTAGDYIMIYDIEHESVDVMYIPGIIESDKHYYTLSSIEEAGI